MSTTQLFSPLYWKKQRSGKKKKKLLREVENTLPLDLIKLIIRIHQEIWHRNYFLSQWKSVINHCRSHGFIEINTVRDTVQSPKMQFFRTIRISWRGNSIDALEGHIVTPVEKMDLPRTFRMTSLIKNGIT